VNGEWWSGLPGGPYPAYLPVACRRTSPLFSARHTTSNFSFPAAEHVVRFTGSDFGFPYTFVLTEIEVQVQETREGGEAGRTLSSYCLVPLRGWMTQRAPPYYQSATHVSYKQKCTRRECMCGRGTSTSLMSRCHTLGAHELEGSLRLWYWCERTLETKLAKRKEARGKDGE
jgi:hypothetical protein